MTDDDEGTVELPSLSLPTADEISPEVTDTITAKLDELIALGRSINSHLEHLTTTQKIPAWRPDRRSKR